MCLGLLKVIAPINRIEPRLEEELGPVTVPHHQAARREALLVLREHKMDVVAAQVAERLDDAVGRDDRMILNHQLLQPRRLHDVLLDCQLRVHDEGVLVQEPDVLGVREFGDGVSHRHHQGPRGGSPGEIVVVYVREECLVACRQSKKLEIFCC